ncbi:cation:proton antiporter [Pengzhenrongella sicca]|uniref:Sodium:proton antiporter n=1 Tax=Pengzhenrongella sicca TaxID=2819238 RepID=A0A8A4ZA67_9MICO|nr:sodium:proton antiporter [Pengzhenrongella sicca]QTE27783.1 sodium:proton antiporter [Pengzhenrongella sicca]
MEYLLLGVVAAVLIVAVNALAPKVGVSAALLLMLLGVGLSLIPAVPAIHLEPEWILAGVLPPLLYSTSVGMPAMDFRRDLTAISGLSVTLVVVTSVALGVVFSAVIPDVGLATGIALGAIVSPTDAVATAIVRRLGVGPRVVTVLEGESLLNDASALVLLRSAIAATAASVSLWHVAGNFLYSIAVAVGIGLVVGRVSLAVRSKLPDAHLTTAISFIVPFIAYLPAERLGASGLVSTVAAGLVTGYGSAKYLRPQDRMAETANWRTLELLLEGGVFLVMGLELFGLVDDVGAAGGSLALALGVGLLGAVVVVALRALYVVPLLWQLRARARRGPAVKGHLTNLDARIDASGLTRVAIARTGRGRRGEQPTRDIAPAKAGTRPGRATDAASFRTRITQQIADIDYLSAEPLGWREGVVLVWAGMRGVVTLAAAQSLPHDTPQRSLLVLIAFVVAASTLLVQGSTLPWLVRRLGLVRASADGAGERAELLGELDALASATIDLPDLRRPDGRPYDEQMLARIRLALEHRHAEDGAGDDDATGVGDGAGGAGLRSAQYRELRLAVIGAQRAHLLHARQLGIYSSAALNQALAVLDADQISTELRSQ